MKDVFVTGGSGFVGRNLIAALVARGDHVRALARSEEASKAVAALGATPVRGELDAAGSYAEGIRGATAIFHVAAKAEEWGDEREFDRVNVDGTQGVIEAARRAQVPTLVHVSTEAVLVGRELVRVDESVTVPSRQLGPYPRTKALAEARIVAASGSGLRTVVVRPRLVWGAGDTSVLPKIVAAVKQGKFAWIGGGHHLTSTTHVQNVVEALLLAEARGRSGQIYFATDGEPIPFRTFLSALLRTKGVDPGERSVPFWLARAIAAAGEGFVRLVGTRRPPPLTRTTVYLFGREVTIDDTKIRRELGYEGRVTRAAGLAEMTPASG